jgi:hypothetical protein
MRNIKSTADRVIEENPPDDKHTFPIQVFLIYVFVSSLKLDWRSSADFSYIQCDCLAKAPLYIHFDFELFLLLEIYSRFKTIHGYLWTYNGLLEK